ncbi:hypothetical protein OE88DRAFT_1643812 [Heliocybe sulcata]|uniref:Uncharacterized protein n=1 Tax=Heliocybe sulcata TaxID=5364 RepID=A0A5C3N7U0_9AGAM|nr:hypothetical protein OE88DRAFT_1643812 [Heliocybe sulcata]
MFQNLVRRISGSFFLRPDRPWSDDATSNAPQIGRKRRLSDSERDDEPYPSSTKRSKGGLVADEERDGSPAPAKETQDVKEIRKGVKDVELEDEEDSLVEGELEKAAAVPLPEDKEEGSEKAEEEKELVEEPEEIPVPADLTSVDSIEPSVSDESKPAEAEPEVDAAPAVSEESSVPGTTTGSEAQADELLPVTQATEKKETTTADVPDESPAEIPNEARSQ